MEQLNGVGGKNGDNFVSSFYLFLCEKMARVKWQRVIQRCAALSRIMQGNKIIAGEEKKNLSVSELFYCCS